MAQPEPSPVHFLLVDDLEGNLLSLEGLLRREGLVLLKAHSGNEALELLLKHDVALAIVDVQMPGMDGFELAELMRGNARTRHVPIIFLTAGTADVQRKFRGYEAGAVDFLNKPIESDILRSKAQVFFELYLQRQQLSEQRDELALADKRKDEFLAVLAHELRNPLTPLRYGIDMMKMAPDKPVPADMQAMMDRQLTHLVRLIDDLMDVSRISRGKFDLRRSHVTVQSTLQAALESAAPLIESHGHELTQSIPAETLWLNADPTRVAQVISNLLNNAAKYTPDGGRIELSICRNGNDVRISVSDNGQGIPREMIKEVFELFTQVHKPDQRASSGLGIGLALAKQLVELHGGAIHAESPGAGKGSTFSVDLPLIAPPEEAAVSGRSTPQTSHPMKVLVVDDNASAAEATRRLIEMIGHEAFMAHDGITALEVARREVPDVIVLDIGMPGLSGHEVCEELRKDSRFERATIIAQTGLGQERDRRRSELAGFDHHLTKPVMFDDLAALLVRRA